MTIRERLEWLVANPEVCEIIVNADEARELFWPRATMMPDSSEESVRVNNPPKATALTRATDDSSDGLSAIALSSCAICGCEEKPMADPIHSEATFAEPGSHKVQRDVEEFHKALDIPVHITPAIRRPELRAALIEEACDLVGAEKVYVYPEAPDAAE